MVNFKQHGILHKIDTASLTIRSKSSKKIKKSAPQTALSVKGMTGQDSFWP